MHDGAMAMGGGSGSFASGLFLTMSLSASTTPLGVVKGMEVLGYIVCLCLRRFLVPLPGQASTSWVGAESKAHPWEAFGTTTDSTFYSKSLQKSVAKNFRKERKTQQSPEPQGARKYCSLFSNSPPHVQAQYFLEISFWEALGHTLG